MTRSSDKNLRRFERKMTNDLYWELPLKVLLSSHKWLGCKNITLLCVIRRINRPYLNFKHQLKNMTYRLRF